MSRIGHTCIGGKEGREGWSDMTYFHLLTTEKLHHEGKGYADVNKNSEQGGYVYGIF